MKKLLISFSSFVAICSFAQSYHCENFRPGMVGEGVLVAEFTLDAESKKVTYESLKDLRISEESIIASGTQVEVNQSDVDRLVTDGRASINMENGLIGIIDANELSVGNAFGCTEK